jgi:hypothetical protein
MGWISALELVRASGLIAFSLALLTSCNATSTVQAEVPSGFGKPWKASVIGKVPERRPTSAMQAAMPIRLTAAASMRSAVPPCAMHDTAPKRSLNAGLETSDMPCSKRSRSGQYAVCQLESRRPRTQRRSMATLTVESPSGTSDATLDSLSQQAEPLQHLLRHPTLFDPVRKPRMPIVC